MKLKKTGNLSSVTRTKSTLLWAIAATLFFSFSERSFASVDEVNEVAAISQQSRTVSGRIVDQAGEPVIGATIIEVGSNPLNGTITNFDGEYTLHLTTAAPALNISFIGFEEMVVNVGNLSTLNLVMHEYASFLDEVVVIGYGTARRRDLTGAISTIRAESLQAEAPRSIQDMLRANAPGLSIGFGTGASGSAGLLVRGDNTLQANQEPLIVLDGVIWQGALSDINPMDIASIDILKDASSAAVFGARAAGGVIVLATQRGARGDRPRINVNTSFGIVQSVNMPELMSGDQFMDWRGAFRYGGASQAERDALIFSDPRRLSGSQQLDWFNFGLSNPVGAVTEEELLRTWALRLGMGPIETENFLLGRTTDWLNERFQLGIQQDYHISVSNRSDHSSYFWSMGWSDREGIIVGDRWQAFRTRLNKEATITPFLRVGVHANFSARNESFISTGAGGAGGIASINPFGVNEIGNPDVEQLIWRHPTGDPQLTNPFFDNRYRTRRDWRNTLSANMFAIVTLPFNIEYQFNFVPYYQWRDRMQHDSAENFQWAARGGFAYREQWKTYHWQIDNILRWNQRFNEIHNVQVTLMQGAERRDRWRMRMEGENFAPSDILGFHNMAASDPLRRMINSTDDIWTGDALMARVFYSLLDRYMLTLSVRRDGFSAFGVNNPRGVFPAAAAAWTFTSEEFAQPLHHWLDFGRLRLSWGENGNRDIGQYYALSNLTVGGGGGQHPYIGLDGRIVYLTQLWQDRMGNADLRWERTAAWNIGLDFAMFNSRLRGNVDLYHSTTHDLLLNRTLPTITGFSSVMANLGKLENRGIEAALNFNVVRNQNFAWTTSGSFAMNRRKLLRIFGDMINVYDAEGNFLYQREVDDPGNNWFIGQDPNRIWQFEFAGVWQEDEREAAAVFGSVPGDLRWVDQNGDGIMNDDDRVFQGYNQYSPRFRWTWRNEFTLYRNWTITTMMYSAWGHYRRFNRVHNNNGNPDRNSDFVQPFWTPDNPINTHGRVGSRQIPGANYYRNMSFIRLDNITLSYNVPRSLIQRASIQNMRISASVRNAAMWAPHWDFWDPEPGRETNYVAPTPRTYSVSLNFTL